MPRRARVAPGGLEFHVLNRTMAGVTLHGPGTGSSLGRSGAEERASPLPAQGGQSHLRGLRCEDRDSPRERLQKPVLAEWCCRLGAALVLLVVPRSYCGSAEPRNPGKDVPVRTRMIGRPSVAMGELRAVRTAGSPTLTCSEVLSLHERIVVKRYLIQRQAYAIDTANRTFEDAEGPMEVPRMSLVGSERTGQYLGGEKESLLGKWQCRLPARGDIAIVVSSGVLELSDGRRIVCRFEPLFLANGSILTRAQSAREEDASGKEHDPKEDTGSQEPLVRSHPVSISPGAIGDVEAVPTADGSEAECSEVLSIPRGWAVKSCAVWRDAYVVDVVHKTFREAPRSVSVRQEPSGWSERFGFLSVVSGEKELLLRKWKCGLPRTADVNIVVSWVILTLSDGDQAVCLVRPLVLANRRVFAPVGEVEGDSEAERGKEEPRKEGG